MLEKKKKKGLTENQKSWLTFGAIALIGVVGGAFLLLLESPQEKAASALIEEITPLKDAGANDKLNKIYSSIADEFFGTSAENAELKKIFLAAANSGKTNVSWDSLQAIEDTKMGAVELKNVKIITDYAETAISGQAPLPAETQEDVYNGLRIKKSLDAPNNYLFEIDSGTTKKFSGSAAKTAEKKPYLISKITGSTGNLELTPQGKFIGMTSNLDKFDLRDGSDSLSYAIIEKLTSKFLRKSAAENNGKNQLEVALAAEKITPGDSFKFLLGPLDSIGFALDFGYEGDDISKLSEASKVLGKDFDEIVAGTPSPELLKKVSAAEKFSGSFNLNKLSVTSGDKGLEASFALQLKNFPAAPMPTGNVSFVIKNYPELLKLLQGFAPISQEKIDSSLKELEEFFVNDGKNLSLQASFDGTKIVHLNNGKNIDIAAKFAQEKNIQADLSKQNLAPENVESTPLKIESSH